MSATVTITVYGKPHCVNCEKTTGALESAQVGFTYHDISRDPAARATALSYGYLQAPIVVLEGIVDENIVPIWSGYNEEAVTKLIARVAP